VAHSAEIELLRPRLVPDEHHQASAGSIPERVSESSRWCQWATPLRSIGVYGIRTVVQPHLSDVLLSAAHGHGHRCLLPTKAERTRAVPAKRSSIGCSITRMSSNLDLGTGAPRSRPIPHGRGPRSKTSPLVSAVTPVVAVLKCRSPAGLNCPPRRARTFSRHERTSAPATQLVNTPLCRHTIDVDKHAAKPNVHRRTIIGWDENSPRRPEHLLRSVTQPSMQR
jgi:hypothetical protein